MLTQVPAYGQSVVRGTVRARPTARLLAGAEISIDSTPVRPVRTNQAGEFTVAGVPRGTLTLRFRAVGYRPFTTRAVLSGQDTVDVDVELENLPQRLDQVAVVGTAQRVRPRQNVITDTEVESVLGSSSDAWDIVRQLRPDYLRSRGVRELDKNIKDADGAASPKAPIGPGSSNKDKAQFFDTGERLAAARNATPALPKVCIDDGPLEELEALRRVTSTSVKEIRFMPSLDATTRYGTEGGAGVILVTLRK